MNFYCLSTLLYKMFEARRRLSWKVKALKERGELIVFEDVFADFEKLCKNIKLCQNCVTKLSLLSEREKNIVKIKKILSTIKKEDESCLKKSLNTLMNQFETNCESFKKLMSP